MTMIVNRDKAHERAVEIADREKELSYPKSNALSVVANLFWWDTYWREFNARTKHLMVNPHGQARPEG